VPAGNLGVGDDPDTRERYETEATRVAAASDADDAL